MSQQRLCRREFLTRSAMGTAAGLMLSSRFSFAQDEEQPLYKISLAEWSINQQIRSGEIDNLDFAKVAKEEFGIDGIEYVSQLFQDKKGNAEYTQEMKKRAEDHGVKTLLIMIDREGDLGNPDEAQRKQVVENHKPWVDMAKELGCHSVRVNAASRGTWDEQVQLAADGLRMLTEYAAPLDMNVIVENHGGLSSNGKWLTEVMKTVDNPRCGTLPDFGNFRINREEEYDRYEGMDELMDYAKAVSAKSYDFDEAGNETTIDFKRMMKIALDHGYHGYVGIEYEGRRLPAFEGIRKTQTLLERVRDELANDYA